MNELVRRDPFNTAGATHPYPQGHAWSRCAFPIYNTDTIALAYTNWKAKFFVNGRVIRKNLAKELMTEDELMTQLRLQGVDQIQLVKAAFLEGNGEISVIQRA